MTDSPKPATKLDTLEQLLTRADGASIAEMAAATGWQPHSVRGALAGALRKRGHAVGSSKVGGTRRYRIDVVVVYKIDRLTRSLTDFSRMIETFDRAGTSFVSVTQSFNTTDSMGRLMLNVLLSFAQFEREVTGERIRDKIAASKAKGMWMGGLPPLGYDLPAASTRTLQVNAAEAELVTHIFRRYLAIGSVHALQRELEEHGIASKRRIHANGRTSGGQSFSRGALFHLLRNRIYLGQIVHKDQLFDGAHEGIVDPALFARVQERLDRQARRRTGSRSLPQAPLAGKLFDAAGHPMSPTMSRGRSGRTYRYYVSAPLQQGARPADPASSRRLAATAIERVIAEAVRRWLPDMADPLASVLRIALRKDGLLVTIDQQGHATLAGRLAEGETIVDRDGTRVTILLPIVFPPKGQRSRLVPAADRQRQPDPILIGALRRAHAMLRTERGMPLIDAAPASPYQRSILRLAFLAPDIQRAILEGRQPPGMNLEALKGMDIPLCWTRQRALLGFDR